MPLTNASAMTFTVGAITRPLGGHVAPVLHAARRRVTFDEVEAQHFRQPPLRRAAPEIHLKEAILRLDEALREEQVVVVPRVDVRHAPTVADDAHGLRETVNVERPGLLRERSGGARGCSRRLAAAGLRAEQAQRAQEPQ